MRRKWVVDGWIDGWMGFASYLNAIGDNCPWFDLLHRKRKSFPP